jgi:hypothetical protein
MICTIIVIKNNILCNSSTFFSLTGRKKTKDFENNIIKSDANGTNFFHSSRRNAFHLSIEIQEASGEGMAVLGIRKPVLWW